MLGLCDLKNVMKVKTKVVWQKDASKSSASWKLTQPLKSCHCQLKKFRQLKYLFLLLDYLLKYLLVLLSPLSPQFPLPLAVTTRWQRSLSPTFSASTSSSRCSSSRRRAHQRVMREGSHFQCTKTTRTALPFHLKCSRKNKKFNANVFSSDSRLVFEVEIAL